MLPNAPRNQVFGARWSIMKKLFGTVLTGLVLTACVPALTAVQIEATISARLTAVASPAAPIAELPSALPQPTDIPMPTNSPIPTRRATSTPRPTQTPAPEYGTRENPHPYGITAYLTKGDELEFTLTITDVKRGDTAWGTIVSANQFNDKAPSEMEYILATVVVEYTGSDKGVLEIELYDWAIITNGQVLNRFQVPSVCCLASEFDDVKLFAGGKAKGVMAWPVYLDDDNPRLVIGLDDDGTGGIFFLLQ